MGIEWSDSASKHGISRDDAWYAVSHAAGTQEVPGRTGETTRVFVGHPHAQTDRWIEVIAARRTDGSFVVFHAMPLGDIYRHLIGE